MELYGSTKSQGRHRRALTPPGDDNHLDVKEKKSEFKKLGYQPALDGMRGLAVIGVMLGHFATYHYFPGGWIGVDVFFVLSGFLITTLIHEERESKGTFSFKKFYARRALRLFPALAALVVIWTVCFFIFRNHAWFWQAATSQKAAIPPDATQLALKGWLGALTYSTNWLRMIGNSTFPLNHFWTLAIEEQFYLLWPVVLLLLLRFRRSDLVALGLCAVSAIWCACVWEFTHSWQHAGFGTDCQASSLLLGAALALAWKKGSLSWIPGRVVSVLAACAAIGLLGCLLRLDDLIALDFLGGTVVIAAATAAIILWVLRAERSPRLLSHPVLVYVGKLSYALYLWHVLFADWLSQSGWLGMVVGVIASFLAAELSRRLVEQPALRRKKKYEVVHAA